MFQLRIQASGWRTAVPGSLNPEALANIQATFLCQSSSSTWVRKPSGTFSKLKFSQFFLYIFIYVDSGFLFLHPGTAHLCFLFNTSACCFAAQLCIDYSAPLIQVTMGSHLLIDVTLCTVLPTNDKFFPIGLFFLFVFFVQRLQNRKVPANI